MTEAKDPMSYTEDELEAMRMDKKCAVEYRDIMKFRKKVMRANKAKDFEKDMDPPGEMIDRMRKEKPQDYAKLVRKMGKKVAKQLQHNISSSTVYPPDTIRDWRMTIRAIEREFWHPTTPMMGAWRPPKTKTAFEKFMSS